MRLFTIINLRGIVLFFAISTLVTCNPSKFPDLIISNINVVDVEKGVIIEHQDVLIAGDKIYEIEDHQSSNNRLVETIDGTRKYLMPGLWDMHAHLRTYNPQDVLPLFILHGVVGIRDLGITDFELVKLWQSAITTGEQIGPRIRTSGCIIEGALPTFNNSLIVDDVQQVKPTVDSLISSGVDFIKLYDTLDKEVYEAIVKYCISNNILTAGHIPSSINQIDASNFGLTSIEHLSGLDNTLHKYYSDEDLSQFVGVLKRNKTYQCPTLVTNRFLASLDVPKKDRSQILEEIDENRRFKLAPNYYKAWWSRIKNNYESSKKQKGKAKELSFYKSIVKQLSNNGIKILAGTDTPNPYLLPGLSLHEELVMLVESGLSNSEALKAATLYPAQYFNRPNYTGKVEENAIADIIILDANPLENIRNTQQINAIVFNGKLFSNDSLNSIREELLKENNKYDVKDFDQFIYMKIQKEGIKSITRNYGIPKSNDEYIIEKHHLLRLGKTLLHTNKIEEAIDILKWNIEIFPEYDQNYFELGLLYLGICDTISAIDNLKFLKRKNPKDTINLAMLKRLQEAD